MTRSVAPFLLAACLFGCASERKPSESPEMVPPPAPAPDTTNEPGGVPPTPGTENTPPTSERFEKSLQAPPPKNDGGIGAAGAGATAGMGGTAPTGGAGGARGIGDSSRRLSP